MPLARAHQALTHAQADVTHHLRRTHRLSDGRAPADVALLERLERAVHHLAQAVNEYTARLEATVSVLEGLEKTFRDREEVDVPELAAPDFAHLLAMARGARLHQHLVTHRLSVITANGRTPYPVLQRLESAGLVEIDRTRPLHAGQRIELTALGRRTLTVPPRTRALTDFGGPLAAPAPHR
ncbi:hypothetical protein VSR01_28200 [Actinacidiphila sp. DG2A-62]|uniref:hypothetical protein n=1 Tax=Actinacidiphila sp. DG2A-62 TaxID=3108821 RepID=UPI002DB58EB0|nr:hypothetical protein [Actinacidiphila sp. DG2A-62]MEC3997174.1 hypothetical protein [Actinacidiphila sp. DG2A-62]